MRNEHSSAALIDNGSKLKHYFDLTQTTMAHIPFQWGIDRDIAEKFLQNEVKTGGRSYRNMASYINNAAVKHIADNTEGILSKFPIIEADRKAFLYSVSTMVMTAVAARCEHKSSYKYKAPDIPDLSALDMLKTNEDTVKLCDTVQKSAKAILSKMKKSITQIINIRTEELKNGRNRDDETNRGMEHQVSRQQSGTAGASARGREAGDGMVRGGAGMVSDVHSGGEGLRNDSVQAESGAELHLQRSVLGRDGGDRDDWALRQKVAGVYGGELPRHGAENEYQQLGLGESGEGSGHRSGGAVSDLGGAVSESQSTSHNVYGDSQVGENEAAGDRSRGDGDSGITVSGVSEQDMETAGISREVSAASVSEDNNAEKETPVRTAREADNEYMPSVDSEPHNFTITDPNLGAGGLKTKCAANIAAIKLLKQLEAKKSSASPEEQEVLSKYVGWGGMAQEVFSCNNAKWAKEHAELKELLSDEEYAAARGSSLNAHYTTPTVINAIYKALDNMGFKKGKVLDDAVA